MYSLISPFFCLQRLNMLTFFLSSIWYKWPYIIRKRFCVLSPHFPLVWWSVVPCWPDSISGLCQSKIWCWQTKHPKDYTKLRLSTDVYFLSLVDNVVLSTSWSCPRTLLSATSFSLPSETGSPQSCLFSATPWTVACQAPLSMEFSWQEYWSG